LTGSLLRKELKVVWASPLPYVLGAVFHATLGVMAWSQLVGREQAVFQPIVPIAGFLVLLVAPILASRAFADEIRTGTLELLLAVDVPRGRLVAAKYAAVVSTLLVLLAPISLFVVLLALYGSPDWGPISTGLGGLVLLGAAVAAVGVCASSLTSSQPLAAIGALFAVLALWFAHTGSDVVAVGGLVGGLSLSERLRSFAGGVVDVGDVVFFASLVVVALAGARAGVESRRWR
jgi:ABC-2 type transport system permease protein